MRNLIILSIVFCLLPSFAFGQDSFEVDGINYSIIKEPDEYSAFGTVQVVPLEYGHYEDEVVIPNAVKQNDDQFSDAYKVIGIASRAFANCEDLESVTLPTSIEFIGEEAFYFSWSLKSIDIPYGNLTEIGEKVFSYCGLKSVHLPKCVSTIGAHAFVGSGLVSIESEGVTSIGEGAFESCTNLSSVIFSESLVAIGKGAFFRCLHLKSITLPSSVKSIGERAFASCENLTEINLPDGIREIKKAAFNHSGLKSISIPSGLSNIEEGVFSVCLNLQSVSLPDGLKRVKDYAFSDCRSLHSLILPESIKSIGNKAFNSCQELEELYLKSPNPPEAGDDFLGLDSSDSFFHTNPRLVIYVPKGRFSEYKKAEGWKQYADRIKEYDFSGKDITSLPYVTKTIKPQEYASFEGTYFEIPEGIEEIGFAAFYGSKNLKTIKMPSTLQKIGESAFKECKSLETIILPPCLKIIEGGAFESCTSLKEISIPEGVSIIDDYTFSNCTNLKTVSLPSTLKSIGECAFENCLSLTFFEIPKRVELISEGAFKDCKNLKSIILPEGLVEIGANAFQRCGLTAISLPKSLRKLSSLAFYACMQLETITIKGDYSSWGKDIFKYNVSELKDIYVSSLPSEKDREVFGKAINKVKIIR